MIIKLKLKFTYSWLEKLFSSLFTVCIVGNKNVLECFFMQTGDEIVGCYRDQTGSQSLQKMSLRFSFLKENKNIFT